MKKLYKIGLLALVALIGTGLVYKVFFNGSAAAPLTKFQDERIDTTTQGHDLPVGDDQSFAQALSKKVEQATKTVVQKISKPTIVHEVPFTSQAPKGDWGVPFNEACEEASMLMAYAWKNELTLDPESATKYIVDFYTWQTEHGYEIDLTAAQTQAVLAAYYQVSSRLIDNPTVTDLTNALSDGNLVIIPAAGRELKNPNFRQPGPLYHMLVITGFDADRKEFITNDPGTRRGEDYRYSYDVIMSAIHDWNDGDVYNGKKVVVVVEK